MISHRPLVPEPLGSDGAVELIKKAASHRQDLPDHRFIGEHRSDAHQPGIAPGLVVTDVLVEPQQCLCGGPKEIVLNLCAVRVTVDGRCSREVISFREVSRTDGFIERLDVASSP